MPYKIIQTIERGKAVLVAVPQQWEQDGILYWPRKNTEKLQRNENSVPDENWSAKNCVLKRNNIVSLQKAESLIDVMCENSDTEFEHEIGQRTRQYTSKVKNITPSNFNDMAEECSKNYNKKILNSNNIIDHSPSFEYVDNQESVIFTQETMPNVVTIPEEPQSSIILQQIEDSRVTNYVLPKIDEMSENLKIVMGTLNTITENQETLFRTQNTILTKLSEMQTQFEEVAKQLFKPTDRTQSSDIKPISSLREFQDFENSLLTNDPEFISNLKNKLSIVCSKGKGKGYNNAYILIDVLFERCFLKDCSWAGGSKSDKIKICFKGFTNTIKLFFNIIHESDGDFTLVDCHKFLKVILRNSLQRCNNKQLRLSSKKNRQKKTQNLPQSQPVELVESQLNQPQSDSMVVPEINLPGCLTNDDA